MIRTDIFSEGVKKNCPHPQTEALQKIIDRCGENGGGVIYFPPGEVLSGTLHLRSNTRFYFEAGAVLKQSKNMADYPVPAKECMVQTTGSHLVFLHGVDLENIIFEGCGTIDGNDALDPKGSSSRGPLTILMENCRNITMRDLTVQDSPGWSVTFFGCQNVNLLHTKNINSNADGINIVCCQDVIYDGVLIEGPGDDGICIKNESAFYLEETAPPCGFLCENIRIVNCTVRNSRRGHPPLKIGTGTHGIFRNITVDHCTFADGGTLFTLQLMRPNLASEQERIIEDITLSNITADNLKALVDITCMGVYKDVIRNIRFENICMRNTWACSRILGTTDSRIERIEFKNITDHHNPAYEKNDPWLTADYVDQLSIQDVWLHLPEQPAEVLRMSNGERLTTNQLHLHETSWSEAQIKTFDVKHIDVTQKNHYNSEPFLYVDGALTEQVTCNLAFEAGDAVQPSCIQPNGVKLHFGKIECPGVVDPDTPIEASIPVTNQGEDGIVKVIPQVNGSTQKGQWVWLTSGEERILHFTLDPEYMPRENKLRIGDQSVSFQVAASPAQFKVCTPLSYLCPENKDAESALSFAVKNCGGESAEQSAEVKPSQADPLQNKLYLEPGEEKITCFTLPPLETGETIQVPNSPFSPWPFYTYSNNRASFLQTDTGLKIIAGGVADRFDETHTDTVKDCSVIYQKVTGDFRVSVKITALAITGMYAAAGLVVSNCMTNVTEEPGNVFMNTTPKYGGFAMYRSDPNGDGILENRTYFNGKLPVWSRLEKSGKEITAFHSFDGQNWKLIETILMPNAEVTQDVGIYANAFSIKNEQTTAGFKDFTIESLR